MLIANGPTAKARRGSSGGAPVRRALRDQKVEAAKARVAEASGLIDKPVLPPGLLDSFVPDGAIDVHEFYDSLKRSALWREYLGSRQLQAQPVSDEDFQMFRILGVGGFGSVCAAIKRDTGQMFAIKRMDKKLIKHKNRYRSCNAECACLKAITSPFVCGLHYAYQTRDDVCLVLDHTYYLLTTYVRSTYYLPTPTYRCASCSTCCTAARSRTSSRRSGACPRSTPSSSPRAS